MALSSSLLELPHPADGERRRPRRPLDPDAGSHRKSRTARNSATMPHRARYAGSDQRKVARLASGLKAATNGSTKCLRGKKSATAASHDGISGPGTMNTPLMKARGNKVELAIAVAA
jgi:hypothetical protein